jgi:O-antigen/teichoic acid export membrane protein
VTTRTSDPGHTNHPDESRLETNVQTRPEGRSLGEGPNAETEPERNNRNLSDLLQELRVAGLGVQVLFGFLLSLPFTVRFTKLDGAGRDLYQATVLLAALAIALLISPVAYHRWVFRRHEKGRLLRLANIQALVGLLMVALAISCAVWMCLIVVGLGWPIALVAAATTGSFAVLWFVLPIFDRLSAPVQRQKMAPRTQDHSDVRLPN